MESQNLSIQYTPISTLVPYARNARTHSDVQVAQIAASIKEFGWTNPVLIDGEKGIIAGHGRVLAAQLLGYLHVPTIELSHLTPNQKKAYVLADNKLALNAGWDIELLRLELGDLNEAEFDLSVIGFSVDELSQFLAMQTPVGATDPDDIPPLPDYPVTEPGDVWLLGNHRLVCGDCTQVDVVDKLLKGVKPQLMVTDPPYGVEYDPSWRGERLKDGANRAEGKVTNDDKADWREAWALFPGDVAYVWHAMRTSGKVFDSLEASGFKIRAEIVWAKTKMVLSRGHYHPQHESCWYAVRETGTGHWKGDRSQTTLWKIENSKLDTGHGTQKPVEAMRRPIENNSSPGQAVYEPFSGSGTTLIACEQSGRVCYAIEIEPRYVDVAVKRWQDFTNKKATLEQDGSFFDDLAAKRQKVKPQ